MHLDTPYSIKLCRSSQIYEPTKSLVLIVIVQSPQANEKVDLKECKRYVPGHRVQLLAERLNEGQPLSFTLKNLTFTSSQHHVNKSLPTRLNINKPPTSQSPFLLHSPPPPPHRLCSLLSALPSALCPLPSIKYTHQNAHQNNPHQLLRQRAAVSISATSTTPTITRLCQLAHPAALPSPFGLTDQRGRDMALQYADLNHAHQYFVSARGTRKADAANEKLARVLRFWGLDSVADVWPRGFTYKPVEEGGSKRFVGESWKLASETKGEHGLALELVGKAVERRCAGEEMGKEKKKGKGKGKGKGKEEGGFRVVVTADVVAARMAR
ncbi:hypothetical protein K491DRAFT_726762 [Lophiostoma macrostomum CBS 122681]|uniref:Uncharacterized protein n=1 Tax=Lophiostoma macrostomum CBS 122681 TaxID=1314788 RepID=A0A6A6SXH5_9PLEO|nr:hypothetical protein K491DRAFT_726762 [Lophiostoma macrostomum CBS 122681]